MPIEMSRGRETILLVEDEPDVRDFVGEVLKSRDCTVLERETARTPSESSNSTASHCTWC